MTLAGSGIGILTVELLTWSDEARDWIPLTWTEAVEESELAGWITASERVLVTCPIRGKP